MSKFKVGDVVKLIKNPVQGDVLRILGKGEHRVTSIRAQFIRFEGERFGWDVCDFVVAVDAERQELSDAIDLIRKHDIRRYNIRQEDMFVGGKGGCFRTTDEILDYVFPPKPDNSKEIAELQGIIDKLASDLTATQTSLAKLKGDK